MPYTAQHKQQTRERIVESARDLFNRSGFAEVSIDQIMGHAGLTRGGFYNHFETKEDLFLEVIEAFGNCNPADPDDSELATEVRGAARSLAGEVVAHSTHPRPTCD